MSTVQYSARLSGLIFFLLLSSVYSQDASSQLEVVYQYHADSLTGRVVKGMVGDTSYFPYDKRNQWQFRYRRQGGPPPMPIIRTHAFHYESNLNGKVYRKYSLFSSSALIRYDSEANKLFAAIADSEKVAADFNYIDTLPLGIYAVMDGLQRDFKIYYSTYQFLNQSVDVQGYYYYYQGSSGASRRYLYSKGLGWIYYEFYACCQGGTNQSLYTLDQAVIWDSLGKTMYFNPANKPAITSYIPDTVSTLQFPVEIKVSHPHNYFYWHPSWPEEHIFIKSISWYGLYTKGADSVLVNLSLVLTRPAMSEKFSGTLQLNDSLMQNGYEFSYRIVSVDKGLIPLTGSFPDSGYKKINYKPVVSSVETEFEKSLQISVSGYPNPLSNAATFRYTVPVSGEVELKIFDILGNELFTVFKQSVSAGSYTYQYSDFKLPSGIYIARLVSNGKSVATKIKILK